MDNPSTSKERIIPIQQVGDDPLDNPKTTSTSSKSKSRKNEDNISRSRSAPEDPDVSTDLDDTGNSANNSSLISTEDSIESPSPTNPDKILPCCNCQERIILVVDRAHDENFTHFQLNEDTVRPLSMMKRAVDLFLLLKQRIDLKHEYALVLLNENSANWAVDFTNNIKKIKDRLKNVKECEAEDIFDLHTLFETILKNVEIPEVEDLSQLRMPPPFVVRTILLYGRSYTVPELNTNRRIENLLRSPYFTLDVLMTHEPADIDNNCNKIFQALQHLDRKGLSYFFPVSRDSKLLHNSMAKLLGHPLQRPTQKEARYKWETYSQKAKKVQTY